MADLNVWAVTGRLTKDAEFRTLASGKALLSFDIAVNTGWGEYAKTTYVRVQQWGERGKNLVQHLKKGKPVAVSGSLSVNTWTGKDGVERQQLALDTTSVQMLSLGQAEKREEEVPSGKPGIEELGIEEIPF